MPVEPACTWSITQHTLFVPGSTGPCSAEKFGIQFAGKCVQPLGINLGCPALYLKVTIYKINADCSSGIVETMPCTQAISYTKCGGVPNNYFCFSPTGSFLTGDYKFDFWLGQDPNCSTNVIANWTEYLSYNALANVWSIITNPC
jgi:hypothetical protein